MMADIAGKPLQNIPSSLMAALARIGRGREVLDICPLPGTGNRSHLVSFADDRIVVRFDGRETGGLVDRELEFRHGYLAARLGLGPDILLADRAEGVLITRFVDAKGFDKLPRPFARAPLRRLATLFARLQAADGFAGVMDPWQKIALYLHDAGMADPDDAAGFGAVWPSLELLRETTAIEPDDLVPCHVDPVPENLLDREQGAILLDWEYAACSHRLWDIAYFASEASLTSAECVMLLEELGQREKLEQLRRWMILTKAVSFAWCLARRERAPVERESWDQMLVERRTDLQGCLEAN